MYICIFALSVSCLCFSLTFSLSLSLSLSLPFCLSFSLFSTGVSRCVYVGHLVSLVVTHACALVLSFSLLFCLSLSLSFLSRSLTLFFSFIHICTYQSWEACMQPHLSGFTPGNSLQRISAIRSLRCLIPAAVTTVSLPSFHTVYVERVQPSTTSGTQQ